MPDEKKQPKRKPGLGDELVEGTVAAKNPGYAAYRREAIAMGEEPLTAEEWRAKKRRGE
jgi:hypothetical protein